MSEKVDTSRGNIDFVQNAIRGAWHEMEELPLQTAELLVALMDERENLNDQMDEHLKQWGMCVEENKRLLAANESLAKDAACWRTYQGLRALDADPKLDEKLAAAVEEPDFERLYLWLRRHSYIERDCIYFGAGFTQSKPEILDAEIERQIGIDAALAASASAKERTP